MNKSQMKYYYSHKKQYNIKCYERHKKKINYIEEYKTTGTLDKLPNETDEKYIHRLNRISRLMPDYVPISKTSLNIKKNKLYGTVYIIKSSISDITYIGSTFLQLYARFKAHVNAKTKCAEWLRSDKTTRMYELNTYIVCDENHLRAYEQLYINKLKPKLNCRNAVNFEFKIMCPKCDKTFNKSTINNHKCKEHININ